MNRRFAPAISLAAAAVVVLVLLGATVATGYAAQGALPGSPLHSVKTGLERAQLALSTGAAGDARLNLRFAEKRLEELAGLIEAGRFGELSDVAEAFEAHIQAAIQGLGEIAQSDPAEAQALAGAVTEALSRYASILTDLAASVPAGAQTPLLRALEASNQGIEVGASEAGENDNQNANENEIDNDNEDLNDNACDTQDENKNENGIENENANENDIENENGNGNENDNEDVNESINENEDKNVNENKNENENENVNENLIENESVNGNGC